MEINLDDGIFYNYGKDLDKPQRLKTLNYALWELLMKGYDTDMNIKYAKNIYVSRYIQIRKNEIENYNTAKYC